MTATLTNPHEYRSCTVKRRYADPARALVVAQMQSKSERQHVWVYECVKYCGGFHLGHVPWQVRRLVAELVKSEEFLKMQGLTVKPLYAVKVFEPLRVH